MNRLTRFREVMRSLDPSGDPRTALANGWAVDRPKPASVAERVTSRVELEPQSIHLILGGVGSGKTTELVKIHRRLREVAQETGDLTHLIDVSSEQRLDHVPAGVLVALAGLRLIRSEERVRKARGGAEPSEDVRLARKELAQLAEGYDIKVPYRDDDDDDHDDRDHEYPEYYTQHVDGVIQPPTKPLNYQVAKAIPYLTTLRLAMSGQSGHAILLFDSLDRVPSPLQFETAVRDDIRALKQAGIGAVVIGPMRFQYGAARTISELFEGNVHFLSELEPTGDGLGFLVEVLKRRVPAALFSPESIDQIGQFSGGVLRDLISIAKAAAEEAYVSGGDIIIPDHVFRAADRFGRVRAVGLDGEQVEALRKVRETGTLVIRGDRELTLLETRRVLDYGGGRFAVHPTLSPLIDAMTVTA